jgi:hypothetical protein
MKRLWPILFRNRHSHRLPSHCDGVTALGVTHFDNSLKTSLGGQFDTSSFNDITIDITVVFTNNETDGSKFAYQNYVIGIVPLEADVVTTQPPSNDICWLCGEAGMMRVGNASGVFDLHGVSYNCLDMEQNATMQLESSSTVCQNIQASLAQDTEQTCDCTMMLFNETLTPTMNSTSDDNNDNDEKSTIEPDTTATPSSAMTTVLPTTLRPSPSPSTSPVKIDSSSSANAAHIPTGVSFASLAIIVTILSSLESFFSLL